MRESAHSRAPIPPRIDARLPNRQRTSYEDHEPALERRYARGVKDTLPIPTPLTREGLRTIDGALAKLGWTATRTYDEFRFFARGSLRARLEGPAGRVQSASIGVWAAEPSEQDDERARIARARMAYPPIRELLSSTLDGASAGQWAGLARERREDAAEFVLESDVWAKGDLQIALFLEHVDDVNPVVVSVELYPLV